MVLEQVNMHRLKNEPWCNSDNIKQKLIQLGLWTLNVKCKIVKLLKKLSVLLKVL